MKPMKKLTALALACALGLSACAGPGGTSSHSAPRQDFTSVPPGAGSTQEGAPAQAMRYRSMWFSYLEWPMLDTSSAEAFTASVDTVLDHCVSLGLNCITVQVRPFADATYESELFPWSHVVTGTQGQAPGFDPLEIFIARAHEKGLAFEAWVNPYRVRLNETRPPNVAENSLENTHPEWVKQAAGGAYLEPSNPDVQAYICKGVEEIVKNYAVDGIQFDDYFYPTTDEAFDAQEYAGLGGGLSLAEWRRQNVNTLVKSVYDTVHAAAAEAGRTVVFGISPQGNNDNNYNTQYSDVGLWLSTPGYVDYVMPQVYWGYDFRLQSGSDRFAFENIVAEWLAMPRSESVALAFGLGAWRIGAGDGSSAETQEWESGHNLADMLGTLEGAGADGYALYRYASLFDNPEYAQLAAQEAEALRQRAAG